MRRGVGFSLNETGSAEARAMLRTRLGVNPYPIVDAAAVAASASAPETTAGPNVR